MGLGKVGLNILQKISVKLGTGAQAVREMSGVFQAAGQTVGDTFKSVPRLTFEDIYYVVKLNNGRISFIPRMSQLNGRDLTPFELPEYLYHITSATNMKSIQSSNILKISANEQLPGVYLLDKENFLTRYLCVGNRKLNLCKSMLTHANGIQDNTGGLVVIKIPTESLVKNGKLRLRTQEDFFYYQDKVYELQRGLKNRVSLRMLRDADCRAQLEKHVLENGLMTKPEFDQFMQEMKQKIHYGYFCSQLAQLEKNHAVEYIFNHDISPDTIKGIKSRRFSLEDCLDTYNGTIKMEALRNLFGR